MLTDAARCAAFNVLAESACVGCENKAKPSGSGESDMAIEQLMQAVLTASPQKRRELEAVISGKATTQKKDTKDETRLVSFSGAARLMSLSRSTVYELVRQGRLDAVELSGTRKITMRSITEFLNGDRPANAKTAEAVKKSAAKYAQRKNGKED